MLIAACEPTPDVTAPRLQAIAAPAFIVGSQINATDLRDDGPPDYVDGNDQTIARGRLFWSGSDPSGICGYDVTAEPGGDPPITLATGTHAKVLDVDRLTDYDGAIGGGHSVIAQWRITAHDCAGNSASVVVPQRLLAIQDDGRMQYAVATDKVHYEGAWTVAECSCWSGGTIHESSTAGASSTFTTTYRRGDHVGLVFATSPARGEAAIYVDDVFVSTIDTQSRFTKDRTVKWQQKMVAGTHRVKIVNLGTTGRQTIGFDAVLTD